MSKAPELPAYTPGYYGKFKCSGGSCPDVCCRNMLIKIDKATFDKYAAANDSILRGKLHDGIEVKSEEPFDARIRLDADGCCPFLDHAGLCTVQAGHGHENLPYACRTYPRTFCVIGGRTEAYLSMGCEAAARCALLDTGLMKLEKAQLTENPAYKSALEPGRYTRSDNALELFYKLREISVYILQLRKYKLWFRVVMLGYYLERADSLISQGQESEIGGYTAMYLGSIEDVDYDKHKDVIPGRPDIKISRIFSFFEFVAGNRENKHRDGLAGSFGQMKEGLGIRSLMQPMREVIDNYIAVRDAYFEPFFENREHILENYLVNAVFSTLFPFSDGDGNSVYGSFVKLASRYSMLKFLLTGIAGYFKNDFDSGKAVTAIAAFSRFFDHDKTLTDIIINSFNCEADTEMPAMCILVKD